MTTYIVTDVQLDEILRFAEYQDWDVVNTICEQLPTLTYCEDCRRYFKGENDYPVPPQCMLTNWHCDKDHFCGWAHRKKEVNQ